jgi:murein tripeptide amidase MpaA
MTKGGYMKTKTCIACSMPMEKPEDFAGKDTKKDYCCHCARPDGSMKSYEECLEDSIKWGLMGENYKMMNFAKKPTEAEMRKGLIAYMATLPAWKNRK